MSLSKQLLILVSALFLMIFSLNFISTTHRIRDYLTSESQGHAQDTATSLGLSISPYLVDEKDPVIEVMIQAIFDMGYFKEIKLVNVDNEPLVVLTQNKILEEVPDWFVGLIPMDVAIAESEISSGWNISGVVYVSINPQFAYLTLYQHVKSSFYYSVIIFILAIIFLLLILNYTLSSLKKIDQLAVTIADGHFTCIEPLPWTTEVRNVTKSMNIMSGKIKGLVHNLNNKLEIIGAKLNKDDLTGLLKKQSFETDMAQLFETEKEAFILMIKVGGLAEMVKELGDDVIDKFLIDFANVLVEVAEQGDQGHITSYRFFGAEFVLLARQIDNQKIEQLADLIGSKLVKLGKKYNKADLAHIGVAPLDRFVSTDENLLAAQEAYEKAQLIGFNRHYIRVEEQKAKNMSEWKCLIFDIVDKRDYKVSFVGKVDSFHNEKCLMEEAFTQAFDKQGKLIAIGTFISIAEKFAKIVDLDKGVTTQVVDYINRQQIQHSVAINVSTRTIKNSDYRAWLTNLIRQNQLISNQLVFSISAYAVTKEVVVYKEFIDFIHNLNAKVIIKRFETQSITPELIRDLKPDYIRLARDIGNGIAGDESKQVFVETLREVGDLLEIKVLAENIQKDEDYHCIKAIGILGASR